jgi:predicted esterase
MSDMAEWEVAARAAASAALYLLMALAPGARAAPRSLEPRSFQRVAAAPAAGFWWPYHVSVPKQVTGTRAVPLLVTPNNTGSSNDDASYHDRAAARRIRSSQSLADALGAVQLMPAFPRSVKTWQLYTHALDRDTLRHGIGPQRRLDLQLIAMIADARRRLATDVRLSPRILMAGFSASGMFANRFTVLHPELVEAAAIGSPGGWPIAPVASWDARPLRYPLGVADVPMLTGHPVNLAALRRVRLFVFLGDRDTNDSLEFTDGYDPPDGELLRALAGATPVARWSTAERMYRAAGLNATFRLYAGVAHTVSPAMRADIVRFLAPDGHPSVGGR